MNKLNLQDLINPNEELDINNQSTDDTIKLIALQNLISTDNIETNSRIKFSQVTNIAKLYLFSEIFDIPFVKNLADHILKLQVSINGLGRKELVDLVGKVYSPLDLENLEKPKKKDIFK